MDEQTQLQIALSMSKEEAKKVKVQRHQGILFPPLLLLLALTKIKMDKTSPFPPIKKKTG